MISDLNTYLNKAVPDTRLTIKKYLDVKFEYLVGISAGIYMLGKDATFFSTSLRNIVIKHMGVFSIRCKTCYVALWYLIEKCVALFQSYCLKVKEMDDEEYSYAALQEPLYRVETGNYEYR